VRWRLGRRVAAPELEIGTDDSVADFYRGRLTDCAFLGDPQHYEHIRARWILERVRGGRVLEIGAGNGGMTRLIAPQVQSLVALDVSTPSLDALRALKLPNVEAVEALLERYAPDGRFDWIVMSEVIEHMRDPAAAVRRCIGWLALEGSLLVTTPHGHWESNEHLQEFSLATFADAICRSGAESVTVEYLRDRDERRRWLVGQATAAVRPPVADDFSDPHAVAQGRKTQGGRT